MKLSLIISYNFKPDDLLSGTKRIKRISNHSKNMRLGDRVAHTEVTLRDKTLQKVEFSKIVVAIGYVLVGLIIVEIILYFRASSFGLL